MIDLTDNNKLLLSPGTILLTKVRLSEETSTVSEYVSDNFHLVSRASTNKFLGIIGDLAEYSLKFIPTKDTYNNIPLVEFLDSDNKAFIGIREEIISSIEKIMFPTQSKKESGWRIERFLPDYFGTVMQDNNTVLLHLVPPGYRGFYVFDGPGLIDFENWSAIAMTKSDLLANKNYTPLIPRQSSAPLSKGNASPRLPKPSIDVEISDPEQYTNFLNHDAYNLYINYINENASVKLEFTEDEVPYFKLILITILPNGSVENINIVQLGFDTSENPYRNLDKYLIREEGGINRYETEIGKDTKDLTSGTLVESKRINYSLSNEIPEYSPQIEYKKGDLVRFDQKLFEFVSDTPSTGDVPIFSHKWVYLENKLEFCSYLNLASSYDPTVKLKYVKSWLLINPNYQTHALILDVSRKEVAEFLKQLSIPGPSNPGVFAGNYTWQLPPYYIQGSGAPFQDKLLFGIKQRLSLTDFFSDVEQVLERLIQSNYNLYIN